MVILILINIFVIIYIYFKYYKLSENINNTNENIKEEDSIILGYISDGEINNNFDFILAQIIELNIKGYIIIEYDKENIDKYNYKIKQNIDIGSNKVTKYEMLVLNFLFSNKTEITKNELEEKLKNTFNSYNTRFNEIGKILNKKLLEENIIDEVKQKELPNKAKRYIKMSILLIVLVSILGAFNILKITLLYMLIYILEKVLSSMLLLKASTYTNKGNNLKYNIDSYKIKLQNEEFLTNKNTMKEIVLNKEFANSLALHINTQAKKVFIDDSIVKEVTKVSIKAISNLLIVFVIIILVGLILAKITMLLSMAARVWMFIILVIASACIADITVYKKK